MLRTCSAVFIYGFLFSASYTSACWFAAASDAMCRRFRCVQVGLGDLALAEHEQAGYEQQQGERDQ